MIKRIHVIIAEPSVIIRSGLVAVLKKMTSLNIDMAEICEISTLSAQLCKYKPDVLIVNPSCLGLFSLSQIKNEAGCVSLKTIALQHTFTDSTTLQNYDDSLSIFDSAEAIKEKLSNLIRGNRAEVNKQELSAREKEIIICVVKGMTNKQIAENRCLSAHTVIAHRRNIANKLQIHSSAGLTIYAIVNKLVEINDVKYTIASQE